VAAGVERLATTDLVALELTEARRDDLVVVDGPAPAWSPFAAWVPYGLRVAHRSTRARFDEATDAEIRVVALGLRDALARLYAALGDAPYNAVVRSAPPGRPAGEFHWHVDLLPRTTLVAGFEEGTGILVNTVPPELAAQRLRDASAS
jgi:UDPglucose--hexose-1-phosphate uridylyltransferase